MAKPKQQVWKHHMNTNKKTKMTANSKAQQQTQNHDSEFKHTTKPKT